MLCDKCFKNSASIMYEQNINGEIAKLNLCKECAQKLGIISNNIMDSMFMSFLTEPSNFEQTAIKEKKCPKCSYTFSDYINTGLVGCSDCYKTFEDRLEPVIKKIHGKSSHIKEKSCRKEIDEVEELKLKLKDCIDKEEYEKAAELRDKIKEINRKR